MTEPLLKKFKIYRNSLPILFNDAMEVVDPGTLLNSMSRAEKAEMERDEIADQYAELEKESLEQPASSGLSTNPHPPSTATYPSDRETAPYCCGQSLSFSPQIVFCYGSSMCTVGRDQAHFCYMTKSTTYGVTVTERFTYSYKCFESLSEEGVSLSGNPNGKSRMVPKTEFKMLKNNAIVPEPQATCTHCNRQFHKICEPYDDKMLPGGFVCATCRREKKMPLRENKYLATKIPICQLSKHLEERVNRYLRGKLEVSGYNKVIIRVLSATDSEVEVKPLMRKYCDDTKTVFPERFPYKSKGIFAFEKIDGVEVYIFGMSTVASVPLLTRGGSNQRNISSIDSVHCFKPAALRTDVYHEILLGYLDYARKLGYTMAHFCTCPPSEGEEFLFHCHPADQKFPNPKRLQDWFKKMLNKGIQEGCVVEYMDIYQQAKDDNLTSPAQQPYFDIDVWPYVFYSIRLVSNLKNSRNSRKKTLENMSADIEKIATAITDPDPMIESEFMDGPNSFLTRCREEHWEFSSLRRAKYYTIRMLKALCKQEEKGVELTCIHCDGASANWHCSECEDFDVCDSCKPIVDHPHQTDKVGGVLEDGDAGRSSKNESVQRCIYALVHACTCRDANCRRMCCHKMKRVVAHTKVCKKRVDASCPVCKQLIALCCYHAKNCVKEGCQVPFCMNIRKKLKELKRVLSRRAALMMRWRIEAVAHASDASAITSIRSTAMEPKLKKAKIDDVLSNEGIDSNVSSSLGKPDEVKQETTAESLVEYDSATADHATSHPPPVELEFVVDVEEMRKRLEPILDQLNATVDAVPFKIPVDPVALWIPDYEGIVKHPMDLSTISAKLSNSEYSNPRQFCDDMWLMFHNAWLYNKKNSKVYKYCTNLSKLFISLIDPVMVEFGYCCGQMLRTAPMTIFCRVDSQPIQRDKVYYSFETTSTTDGLTVTERFVYCPACFEDLPEDGISLSEDPSDKSQTIPKSAFMDHLNGEITEPFEKCTSCHRKCHKICSLQNQKKYPEGFTCKACQNEKEISMEEEEDVMQSNN